MMSDAPQLIIVGRTSSWQTHLPAAAAIRANQVANRDGPAGQMLVTWLRHRSYGLVGVYTTNDAAFNDLERQRGVWVQVTGSVRPCRVAALGDDPRSAQSPLDAPLLVALTSVEPLAAPKTNVEQPQLPSPQSIRVSSNHRAGDSRIGSVIGWPDAVIWQKRQGTMPVFASWNTVCGVVTRFGQHRYLRYVLRYTALAEESRERHA